jgi:hypothetical protein
MYKIIDSLSSIFKLIKKKEQTGDDQILQIIEDQVGISLQEGPFKMWVNAIRELVSGMAFTSHQDS